jgi:superfamily II helicase
MSSLTTPEKWDSMTRKWTDLNNLVTRVGILLIDEIHLLDDSRGPTLEAVVSRMQAIQLQNKGAAVPVANLRIVALSASVQNVEDMYPRNLPAISRRLNSDPKKISPNLHMLQSGFVPRKIVECSSLINLTAP